MVDRDCCVCVCTVQYCDWSAMINNVMNDVYFLCNCFVASQLRLLLHNYSLISTWCLEVFGQGPCEWGIAGSCSYI